MPINPNIEFNPIITEPLQLKLIGSVFFGNPFHNAGEWSSANEIGLLWQRYMQLCATYKSFLSNVNPNPQVAYEIHIETVEFELTQKYIVFVGNEISVLDDIPLEFFLKILPTTRYVQFTTKGPDSKIAEYVCKKWLGTSQSKYEQAYPYVIQRYDERFKGVNHPESEIDWLIPICSINESIDGGLL